MDKAITSAGGVCDNYLQAIISPLALAEQQVGSIASLWGISVGAKVPVRQERLWTR